MAHAHHVMAIALILSPVPNDNHKYSQCSSVGVHTVETGCYSGALRHGSAISHISAISAHEYHLHLICISLACLHVTAPQMFCIER